MYAIFNRNGAALAACHDEPDALAALFATTAMQVNDPTVRALVRAGAMERPECSRAALVRACASAIAAQTGLWVGRARQVGGEWVPMLHA